MALVATSFPQAAIDSLSAFNYCFNQYTNLEKYKHSLHHCRQCRARAMIRAVMCLVAVGGVVLHG